MEDNQISITDPADTGGSKRDPKAFSYDFAYDSTSTQESVHLDLGAPIVEKALQGYNGESRSLLPCSGGCQTPANNTVGRLMTSPPSRFVHRSSIYPRPRLSAFHILLLLCPFKATIFAYGQTGSGKTHTMMGGDTPDGIIPRLNSQLFSEVQVKLIQEMLIA